jgi:L-asparaginase
MKIKIYSCGGTFEKIYDPLTGQLIFKNSCLTELMDRSRVTQETTTETILLKDSLDMTEKDRELILSKINLEPLKQIILIHGTDTMIETAKFLMSRTDPSKTIVITGAMVPYSLKNSDAFFNLGSAFMSLQSLSTGVWIVMNGRCFKPNEVIKNKNLGIFQEKN